MRGKGLLSSVELRQYLLETSVYPREPEILKELRAVTASHARGFMATEPDAGQFLNLLLEIINPTKTIEIGVFTGYSLLLTALATPKDAKITAIDPDQKAFDMGLSIIKKSGVEQKINFINSVAHPVLDQLLQNHDEHGTYDFAYVDADKVNYAGYHEKLLKLVKPGGIIVYDNTLWMGFVVAGEDSVPENLKEQTSAVIEFNKLIAADDRVHISHLPAGDGMTICKLV